MTKEITGRVLLALGMTERARQGPQQSERRTPDSQAAGPRPRSALAPGDPAVSIALPYFGLLLFAQPPASCRYTTVATPQARSYPDDIGPPAPHSEVAKPWGTPKLNRLTP